MKVTSRMAVAYLIVTFFVNLFINLAVYDAWQARLARAEASRLACEERCELQCPKPPPVVCPICSVRP